MISKVKGEKSMPRTQKPKGRSSAPSGSSGASDPSGPSGPPGPSGSAGISLADEPGFLLSQVAAHSASGFAKRLEPLGFKPAYFGILRVIETFDGQSQQALGEKLGMFASRLVGLLDEMEKLGLVERRNSPSDRRTYALFLTAVGKEAVAQVTRVSMQYQDALEPHERELLVQFLQRIATEQGLTAGVHPNLHK
jgi:DNA-binding MarR family transcriptional regulator